MDSWNGQLDWLEQRKSLTPLSSTEWEDLESLVNKECGRAWQTLRRSVEDLGENVDPEDE